MMFRGFEAHGSVEVSVQGQVLYVEAIGPWNLESLKQSAIKSKPLIEKLSKAPWGVMVFLHGEAIYVPAAAQKLATIIQHEKSIGRKATALMVNDCASPNFAKLHMSDIYSAAGENFEFFDDETLALAWIYSQLQDNHQ